MKLRFSITLIVLLSCCVLYPWRVEDDYLIIEKGDILWEIAHSFYGSGLEYKKVWDLRVDKERFKNPNLIYDGMKFHLPFNNLNNDDVNQIDSINSKTITDRMDTIITDIKSSKKIFKNIEENTKSSFLGFIFEKVLLSLALSVASSILVWLLLDWDKFRRLFKR